jgi:hypothetical protein
MSHRRGIGLMTWAVMLCPVGAKSADGPLELISLPASNLDLSNFSANNQVQVGHVTTSSYMTVPRV